MARQDETFIQFNFDELWTRYSDDNCVVVCFSERDICILLSALRFADWPSRWVGDVASPGSTAYPFNLLTNTGRGADFIEAINHIETLRGVLLMASCLDIGADIKAGLETLAAAVISMGQDIYNKPCCGDTVNVSVVAGATEGGNVLYGTQEGLSATGDPETDPPPDGFDTWEEYFTHKCQAANFLFDAIVNSLRNLGFVSLVNVVGGSAVVGAALAGFLAVPGGAIALIVGGILVLGAAVGVLTEIADELEDNRSDFVCDLYRADSASSAADVVAGYVDEALAALAVASSLHPTIRTIALLLASTDALNKLFDATLTMSYPDADCSACEDYEECIDNLYATIGTITNIEDNGDGTYWLTLDTDYMPAEDHEVAEIQTAETYGEGGFFLLGTCQTLAGAPVANGDYWRESDGTIQYAFNPNDGLEHHIYRCKMRASVTTSPNAATLWRLLVSCESQA